MKKKGRVITALATTGAALALTITPALAATVYAQGGTWNYGVGNTYVWSYYSHNGRTHSASVKGNYSTSSGWTRPGVTARASATKAWTGNQSYYNVK